MPLDLAKPRDRVPRKAPASPRLVLIALLTVSLALAGCGRAQDEPVVIEHDSRDPLTFGVLPYLQRESLERTLGPLMSYLTQGLDRPVRLRVARTYAELERLMMQRRLDLGWFAPALGGPGDGEPLAIALCLPTGEGGKPYRGLVIARNSRPAPTLAGLTGKRFLYVDPNSRSGFLYPNRLLASRGLDPLRDFASIAYAGSHDRVIERLLAGDADAGAVSETAFAEPRRAALLGRELIVLERTDPIPRDPIVAAAAVEASLREQVRSLFVELPSRPGGAAVLAGLRATLGVEGFR